LGLEGAGCPEKKVEAPAAPPARRPGCGEFREIAQLANIRHFSSVRTQTETFTETMSENAVGKCQSRSERSQLPHVSERQRTALLRTPSSLSARYSCLELMAWRGKTRRFPVAIGSLPWRRCRCRWAWRSSPLGLRPRRGDVQGEGRQLTQRHRGSRAGGRIPLGWVRSATAQLRARGARGNDSALHALGLRDPRKAAAVLAVILVDSIANPGEECS
jgi:hypothetical protein